MIYGVSSLTSKGIVADPSDYESTAFVFNIMIYPQLKFHLINMEEEIMNEQTDR